MGSQYKRLMNDVKRVWPGPGENGLHLQQVGVTVAVDDVCKPCIRI